MGDQAHERSEALICDCWTPVHWGARTGSVGPWSYAGLSDGARRWLLAKADPYHQHANQMMAWGGVRKSNTESKAALQPWQVPTPEEALAWAEANDRLDASRRHAGAMAFLASFGGKA
jgi:hypothetical protein